MRAAQVGVIAGSRSVAARMGNIWRHRWQKRSSLHAFYLALDLAGTGFRSTPLPDVEGARIRTADPVSSSWRQSGTAMPRHMVDELAKALDRAAARQQTAVAHFDYRVSGLIRIVPDVRESSPLWLIEFVEGEWGGCGEHDPHVTADPPHGDIWRSRASPVELTEASGISMLSLCNLPRAIDDGDS